MPESPPSSEQIDTEALKNAVVSTLATMELSQASRNKENKMIIAVGAQKNITTLVGVLPLILLVSWKLLFRNSKKHRYPPVVPGIPIVGNLLQLAEKKPYQTFCAWAEHYGPIFTIKTGRFTMVVISSGDLAKEAMITKYASISTRKMSTALSILTENKSMVAMSDYGDMHRMLKQLVVTHLLGPVPQRANRKLREKISYQMLDNMYAEMGKSQIIEGILNIRDSIKRALFPFSMYQVLGRDPEEVFVKKWNRAVSRWEIFDILVMDPLRAVIEVDWRDFFPALGWVPNSEVVKKIKLVASRRTTMTRALIAEQRELLANGKKPDCYLDMLLTQAPHLSEIQLVMSTWEPIIESADTTLVTIEWAMYEILKNWACQDRLYKEILKVTGSRIVNEDDLPKLRYLDAIVKETLRKYPPVALIPPRHVDQDTCLGGYDIKKGWQIIINVYGINYDKNVWGKNPEVWDPERVLGDDKLDMGYKDHRALPFGAGKRMCAGVTQAMYIIPMTIAYFVQHFEWALPQVATGDCSKGVVDTVFLTTHKLHPLEAVARPRHPARLPQSLK